MSKARRCDSCRGFFDASEADGYFVSIPEIEIATKKSVADQHMVGRKTGIDLCPDCSKILMIWLNTDVQLKEDDKKTSADCKKSSTDELLAKMKKLADDVCKNMKT